MFTKGVQTPSIYRMVTQETRKNGDRAQNYTWRRYILTMCLM